MCVRLRTVKLFRPSLKGRGQLQKQCSNSMSPGEHRVDCGARGGALQSRFSRYLGAQNPDHVIRVQCGSVHAPLHHRGNIS